MHRLSINPRSNWENIVEEQGLVFHHIDDELYWNESVYYKFSSSEIDEIEEATEELHRLSLKAVEHVIWSEKYDLFGIPNAAIPLIKWSWEKRQPSLYGRMDLVYDGKSPPKLLEYNADTPTALLEASVIQWFWLKDKFPHLDQFNSIHEHLVPFWSRKFGPQSEKVYFAYTHDDVGEDVMTTTYLRQTADDAGVDTASIRMCDIGYLSGRGFVDLDDEVIRSIFKLYPWEWLLSEEFAAELIEKYTSMLWIEPIWKLIVSSKGILPILWELNPGHPNLLEAYFEKPRSLSEYARKPLFSREGGNIKLLGRGVDSESSGTYGKEGYVYQKLHLLPSFLGNRPVVGSWIIDGKPCGIGIRESTKLITDQEATFVPHVIE